MSIGWARSLVPVALLGVWCFGGMWVVDRGMREMERRLVAPATAAGEVAATEEGHRVFRDADSHCWLEYARQLREEGGWRVRHSDVGNGPQGREMHWSQGMIWGLEGLWWAGRMWGMGEETALEWAGRAVLPTFAFLFFTGLFFLLRKRVGTWEAAALSVLYPIWRSTDFSALRPDHQALQIAAALVFSVCLVLGDVGLGKTGKGQRRLFVLAGAAAAVGMWTGATVFFFVFAVAAMAAFLGIWAGSARADQCAENEGGNGRPGALWRLMGAVGAVGALGFYVLEYAPHFPGMRLEVNHPLYAGAFWGVCEVLGAWADWRCGVRRSGAMGGRGWGRLAAGVVLAGALPAAVLLGPTGWYWPRETLMLRLHARYIVEFIPLARLCSINGAPVWQAIYATSGPVALCALLCMAFPRWTGAREQVVRGRYVYAVALGAGMLALTFWQVRWASYALAGTYAVLVAGGMAVREGGAGRRGQRLAYAVVLALLALDVGCSVAPDMWTMWKGPKMLPSMFRNVLQMRDFALRWREVKGEGGARPLVLGSSDFSPPLAYYGRARTVTGLYWENLDGMKDGIAVLADRPPYETARRILKERGITHVVAGTEEGQAAMVDDLLNGMGGANAAGTLAAALSGAKGATGYVPAFLRYDETENERLNPVMQARGAKGVAEENRLPLKVYRVVWGEEGKAAIDE